MSDTDHVLPDVLASGLRVVFCGTAAGSASARAGLYYAGRGNRFWSTLHHVGLTPRELLPREFLTLPSFGLGLTDACKVAYGMDHEIAADAYDIEALEHAISTYVPRMLAFTSKRAAVAAFGLRATRQVAYGPQHRTIGGAPTWILPSPSGAARRSWSVEPWSALAKAVAGVDPIDTAAAPLVRAAAVQSATPGAVIQPRSRGLQPTLIFDPAGVSNPGYPSRSRSLHPDLHALSPRSRRGA